ncbi:MAG: hypothetical protein IKZ44_10695 [Clostridia bacterium]|nr:hypothetical protein [Clostridia bacterium]
MKRIIVIFLALAMLVACVPTPTEEVVVNKTEGKLEEKIESTDVVPAYTVESESKNPDAPQSTDAPTGTLRSTLGAPEHVAETVSGLVYGGTMDVMLDADVQVPNVSTVPVYRAALGSFSAEERERMAKTLLGDGPYVQFRNNVTPVYEATIRYFQEWLNALESKPYGPNADYAYLKEYLSDWLSSEQQGYQTVMKEEQPGILPWTGSWADTDSSVSNEAGQTLAWYESDAKFCLLNYQRQDDPMYFDDRYHAAPRNDAEREADAAAKAFLAEMHSTEVKLKGVGAHDESIRNQYGSETGYENGVYNLYYLPTYSGIPVYPWKTYHGTDNGKQDAGVHYDYNAEQENISVVTDHGEVIRVDWKCPVHVLGVENENVQLLPFDRIMEIFRQQIFMNIYIGKDYLGNDSHTNMRVTGIYFSYMRIRKPNEDGYWLLPVWDFRGYSERVAVEIDDWWDAFSLLTVNAIDGSIIDRDLGY